jgi:replicative DNA helicase
MGKNAKTHQGREMSSIYSIETECRLLGGCLSSVNWLNEVMSQVKADHLVSSESRLIFDIVKDLYENDREVVFATIHPRIEGKVPLVEVLVRLLGFSHVGFYIEDLIQALKSSHQKRQLVEIGKHLADVAAKPEVLGAELIREVEEKLFSLSSTLSSKILRPLSEISNDPIPFPEVLQKRQQNHAEGISSFDGFPTHFLDLDRHLKGLVKGHFTIIGARPGVGKTSFALNIMENVCLKNKIPLMFFSLEMPSREIVEKMFAQCSEVPYQKIATGSLNGLEYQTVFSCYKAWQSKTLIIDDQPSLGIDQIKARALRAKRIHNIQAIFIDYVQLVTSKKGSESRYLEVGDISRKCKEIAKELQIPVIALAQLNRDVEKRTDKTPHLSDLRESGSLEADADEVILLHRPELYDKHDKPGLLQVFISKNRFGPTGMFEMIFEKDTGKIKNYDRTHG